jgi:hypothetical protein
MMNIAKTVKTLCIVGVASLGLQAGASLADYEGYRGYNPYMPSHQSYQDATFRAQVEQFDARMDRQLQRILNGMESGKVTMKEAIRLLQEHQAINALERQYSRDGRLGPRELMDLDRRLDQANSNIFWEKHDYDRAGFNGRPGGWR